MEETDGISKKYNKLLEDFAKKQKKSQEREKELLSQLNFQSMF